MKVKIKNIKLIIPILILIILVIASGTFAWLSYRTNDTALVLTVGDIDKVRVTLSPYQIKGTIAPVTTYSSSKIVTNVTVVNNSAETQSIRLFYKINKIASELASTNLKYTITKSTNNTTYNVLANGTFSTAVNNGELNLTTETISSNTTAYYKVYLWLDGNNGNQTTLRNKILDAELNAEIILND